MLSEMKSHQICLWHQKVWFISCLHPKRLWRWTVSLFFFSVPKLLPQSCHPEPISLASLIPPSRISSRVVLERASVTSRFALIYLFFLFSHHVYAFSFAVSYVLTATDGYGSKCVARAMARNLTACQRMTPPSTLKPISNTGALATSRSKSQVWLPMVDLTVKGPLPFLTL